jgi:hypothetical protein
VAAYKSQFRTAQNAFLDDGLEYVATVKVRVADNRERQAAITAGLGRKG